MFQVMLDFKEPISNSIMNIFRRSKPQIPFDYNAAVKFAIRWVTRPFVPAQAAEIYNEDGEMVAYITRDQVELSELTLRCEHDR